MTDTFTQTICDTLSKHKFTHNSYNAKYDAQRNLLGKTHYVDDDTLRFFKSRINHSLVAFNGLVFVIVESCAINPDNTQRGHRFVAFDLCGNVISRQKRENMEKSTKKALDSFYTWQESFDVKDYYKKLLLDMKQRHEKSTDKITNTLGYMES